MEFRTNPNHCNPITMKEKGLCVLESVHITYVDCSFRMSPGSHDLQFPDSPCHFPRELSLKVKAVQKA